MLLFADMTGTEIALIISAVFAGIGILISAACSGMAAIWSARAKFLSEANAAKLEQNAAMTKATAEQQVQTKRAVIAIKEDATTSAAAVKKAVAEVASKAVEAAATVKDAVAQVAEKADATAEDNKHAIAEIGAKQDEQHKAWNSRLTEYMALIEVAQMAKGVLLGRAQLQAEIDAKAIVVAETRAASEPQAPLPVTIVPAETPLPVDVVHSPIIPQPPEPLH
jgi:hypothetical protein